MIMFKFTLVKAFTFVSNKDYAMEDTFLHSWREKDSEGKWINCLASVSDIGPKCITNMFPFIAACLGYSEAISMEYVSKIGTKTTARVKDNKIIIKYYEQ